MCDAVAGLVVLVIAGVGLVAGWAWLTGRKGWK